MQDYDTRLFNKISPIVLLMAGLMILVEIGALAGTAGFLVAGEQSEGFRLLIYRDYAFSPELWQHNIDAWSFPPADLLRLLTYSFLHDSFIGLAFGVVLFVAFGKGVSERFGPWAVVLTFFVGAIVGAVVYGTFLPTKFWLSGAFNGDYALIGAFSFARWSDLKSRGGPQILAFRLIIMLLIAQLIFGALAIVLGQGSNWAWAGELAAFITGFLLAFLFEPSARRAFLARLRNR